jgi:uncharacterized protein YgiM (DUF1202 family)
LKNLALRVGLIVFTILLLVYKDNRNSQEHITEKSSTTTSPTLRQESSPQISQIVSPKNRTYVRTGPGKGYLPIGYCIVGENYQILNKDSGWYYVNGKYEQFINGSESNRVVVDGDFWIGQKAFDK